VNQEEERSEVETRIPRDIKKRSKKDINPIEDKDWMGSKSSRDGSAYSSSYDNS